MQDSTDITTAWRGSFGDAYQDRQNERHIEIKRREILWSEICKTLPFEGMKILEVGAGMGANLWALRRLHMRLNIPHDLHALEPNAKARLQLDIDGFQVRDGSSESLPYADNEFDFVFTYGLLIHLDDPLQSMSEIKRVSRSFIGCIEYFSPYRQAIPYRIDNKTMLQVPLFKDDFGAYYMDSLNLRCLSYGFAWKRMTGLDNVSWFLFEKPSSGAR